jgi:hypothetical protein
LGKEVYFQQPWSLFWPICQGPKGSASRGLVG